MRRSRSHYSIIALALVCALGGLLLSRLLLSDGDSLGGIAAVEQATTFPPRPVPEFALLNQRGEPVGREFLQGQWQLVFFGFTNCPDICPPTMITMSQVRARLLESGHPAPDVVLISVDPDRDDPATMDRYVRYFDPDFKGLTAATRDDIQRFAAQMGVPLGYREPDATGAYTVDHSGAIFVVNPQAEMVAIFTSSQPFSALYDVDVLVRDLRRILGAAGG